MIQFTFATHAKLSETSAKKIQTFMTKCTRNTFDFNKKMYFFLHDLHRFSVLEQLKAITI